MFRLRFSQRCRSFASAFMLVLVLVVGLLPAQVCLRAAVVGEACCLTKHVAADDCCVRSTCSDNGFSEQATSTNVSKDSDTCVSLPAAAAFLAPCGVDAKIAHEFTTLPAKVELAQLMVSIEASPELRVTDAAAASDPQAMRRQHCIYRI